MAISNVNTPTTTPLSVESQTPEPQTTQTTRTGQAQVNESERTAALRGRTGTARDGFGGAAPTGAPAAPVVAGHTAVGTLVPTTDFRAAAEAFNALGALVGQMQGAPAPSGRFEGSFLSLDQPVFPGATYPTRVIGAMTNVLTLVQSGQITLPANLRASLEARLGAATSPPPPGLGTLSAAQQAAVTSMVATTVATLRSTGVRLTTSSATATARLQADDIIEDARVASPALRQAMAIIFGFVPPLGGEADGEGGGEPQSDGVEDAPLAEVGVAPPIEGSTEAAVTAAGSELPPVDGTGGVAPAADVPAAHEEVIIPGPEIVKLENAFRSVMDRFSGMDIESLVQLVMAQSAQDAAGELRDVVKEMDAINKKKKAQREFIQHLKEQKTKAQSELRLQYDERRRLDPMHDLYVPPDMDFDTFCERQKLAMMGGSFDGTDGVPPGDLPVVGVSPNTFFEPKPPDVELARRLNITSGQAAALKRVWDDDPALRLEWGTMEEWLVGAPGRGGVGLVCPSDVSQSEKVDTLIRDRDPENVIQAFATKFNISVSDASRLRQHYQNELTPEQQAGGFDAWAARPPPGGPGLVAHGDNAGKVDDFLGATAADGTTGATLTPAQIAERFDIGETLAEQLLRFYDAMPGSWQAAITFEDFLTKTDPLGVGMTADGTGNVDTARSFLATQRHMGVPPGPYTARGETRDQGTAVQFVRNANEMHRATADELCMQAFERIPAAIRGQFEEFVKGYVWLNLMDAHEGVLGGTKKQQLHEELIAYLEGLSPDNNDRQAMLNYLELRLADVQCDIGATASQGSVASADSWLVQSGIVFDPGDDAANSNFNHVHGLGHGRVAWQDSFIATLNLRVPGTNPGEGTGDYKYLDDDKWTRAGESIGMAFFDGANVHEDYVDSENGLPPPTDAEIARMEAVASQPAYSLPDPATLDGWPRPVGEYGIGKPLNWDGLNPDPLSTAEQAELAGLLAEWDRAARAPMFTSGADATNERLMNDPNFKQLLSRWYRDHGDEGFDTDMRTRARNVENAHEADLAYRDEVEANYLRMERDDLPFPPPAGLEDMPPLTAAEREELAAMQARYDDNRAGRDLSPETWWEGVDQRRYSELRHRAIDERLSELEGSPSEGGDSVIDFGALMHFMPSLGLTLFFPPAEGPQTTEETPEEAAARQASLAALTAQPNEPPHDSSFSEMSLAQLDNEIEAWTSAKDSTNDQSESMQLRIQMYTDRYTKANSMLSNLLKKFSDTSSGIISNMK